MPGGIQIGFGFSRRPSIGLMPHEERLIAGGIYGRIYTRYNVAATLVVACLAWEMPDLVMSILVFVTTIVSALVLLVAVYFIKRAIRRKEQKRHYSYWSIGFQTSAKPFDVDPLAADVYSRNEFPQGTAGVADPFLFRHDNAIYLFYELIVESSAQAKIAVSSYNEKNQAWDFLAIVLDEPFHLSYPYVFRSGTEIYMIPETKQAQSVRLYRAVDFPARWELERTLIYDKKYVDSSIVYWQGYFYLFASRKRNLYLYFSESLDGEWQLHPGSPLRRWNYARCGGRILEHEGRLYRFAQEQAKGYAMGVRRYQILELSTTKYKERPADKGLFVEPCGESWAQRGMHHVDMLQLDDGSYLSVFDGKGVVESP
jgi:hypothetical protein